MRQEKVIYNSFRVCMLCVVIAFTEQTKTTAQEPYAHIETPS